MMKSIKIGLVLAFLSSTSHAIVCKSIDDDGVVSYADVPAAECAQPVKLPEYSTYAPRTVRRPTTPTSDSTARPVRFSGYETMAIVSPEQRGTVRSNEGKVLVAIALDPELQAGHAIQLRLDDRAVSGSFDTLTIELNGVDRGTHRLQAWIADATGKQLKQTDPVSFTLRKQGLNDIANQPENPVEPAPPTFQPASGPDYSPDGGSIPSTPGGDAAFKPNFSP